MVRPHCYNGHDELTGLRGGNRNTGIGSVSTLDVGMNAASVDYLVPYTAQDASVRERVFAWANRLPITHKVLIGLRTMGTRSTSDATVVFRHISNVGQGWPEQRVLNAAAFGIYELDDGLPLDTGRLPELGRWWKPLVAKSRIANRAAQSADRLIVGNELLAEWAGSHNSDVHIIPTCIEPMEYEYKTSYQLDGPGRLVWIGSQATEIHLCSIAPALRQLYRLRGVRVSLIGDSASAIPQDLAEFTDKIPWSPEAARDIASFGDIGIMPLPNRPYERMKCAYKLLQYAAAGLPIVGSPVGASSVVLKRSGAPSPSTSDEWIDAVCSLVDADSATREASGRAAFVTVKTGFSFDAWRDRYLRALTPR